MTFNYRNLARPATAPQKLTTLFELLRKPNNVSIIVTMFSYGILLVLSTVSGVISARLLGVEGRGQLSAVQTWPMLLASFGHLGVPDALVYFIARNRQWAGRYLAFAYSLVILASLVIACGGFFLLPVLIKAQQPDTILTARLFLLYIPLWMLIAVIWSAFQGLQHHFVWNSFRLIPAFALCLANLIMWWRFSAIASVHLLTNLLLVTFSVLTLSCLAFALLHIQLQNWRGLPHKQDFLRYGLYSVTANGPRQLNLRLDQGMMAASVAPSLLGLYAVGTSWAYLGFTIVIAIGSASIASLAKLTTLQEKRQNCLRIMKLTVLSAAVIAVVVYLFTPFGIKLLFSEKYLPAVPVTRILVIAAFVSTLNGVWGDILRGLGAPQKTLIAEGVGLFFTVIGLLVFLPSGGVYAAALVSFVAYVSTNIIEVMFIFRQIKAAPLL